MVRTHIRHTKVKAPAKNRGFNLGTPDRARTYDLWLRKPTLYPSELRVHVAAFYKKAAP